MHVVCPREQDQESAERSSANSHSGRWTPPPIFPAVLVGTVVGLPCRFQTIGLCVVSRHTKVMLNVLSSPISVYGKVSMEGHCRVLRPTEVARTVPPHFSSGAKMKELLHTDWPRVRVLASPRNSSPTCSAAKERLSTTQPRRAAWNPSPMTCFGTSASITQTKCAY